MPLAAGWLMERSPGAEGPLDLEGVVCVTPGRRAGRLLVETLARQAAALGRPLVPPRAITPGRLAEELLDVVAPAATPFECTLAWMHTLRDADEAVLAPLLPTPPGAADVLAWTELAGTIDGLHDELCGERVAFGAVAEAAERREMFGEGDRWRALERLEAQWRDRLRAAGLVDPRAARAAALESTIHGEGVRPPRLLVLVGVVDLTREQRAIVAALGDRAVALVHAPAALAERFDALGCVDPDAWSAAPVGLDDEQIRVAEDPADQAQLALRLLAETGAGRAAEDVTIGLADPPLGPVVARAAAYAGLSVHDAAGVPLDRTGPYRLLEAAAAWLELPRHEGLAALARHPDLERRLAIDAPGERLETLDRAYEQHLDDHLERPPGPKDHAARRAREIRDAIDGWLAPLRGPARPLAAWCTPILEVLAGAYGDDPANATEPSARRRADACLALRDAAERVERSAPGLLPDTGGAAALRLVLAQARGATVPEEATDDAVEMLGWLELQSDPAPVLVLLGFNEGRVPERVPSDPFLPDGLRSGLGLACDRRRYARDAYTMEALRHARERLVVIAGRRASDREPLDPSRLLFACDDDAMLARVRAWCDAKDVHPGGWPAGAPPVAGASAFVVPPIPAGLPAPAHMRVTEFSAYLACPYRWALARLVGIEAHTDDVHELDALSFGILAHDVLEAFGDDPDERDLDDAAAIERVLLAHLDRRVRERYGRRPLPAIRIQVARLGERLRAFARIQAIERRAGWRIVETERSFKGTVALDVPDGAPMPLHGKIDRIDRHDDGRLRILDYKSGDRGKTPFETHHGRKRPPDADDASAWLDLQLPLYAHLASASGLADAPVELGYVLLPKEPGRAAFAPATWTPAHLATALDVGRAVVADLRARCATGDFTPNPDAAAPWDPFARICQTNVFVEVRAGAEDAAQASEGGGGA